MNHITQTAKLFIAMTIVVIIVIGVYFQQQNKSSWQTHSESTFSIDHPVGWLVGIEESFANTNSVTFAFCPPEYIKDNAYCEKKKTQHMPSTYDAFYLFKIREDGNENTTYYSDERKLLGSAKGFRYEVVLSDTKYRDVYEKAVNSFVAH